MPQIFMMIAPLAQRKVQDETLDNLGRALISDVEKVYGLEVERDVAFTALNLVHTIGEADIQIEIRYTVGTDEYEKGKIFDPPEEKKRELVDKIARTVIENPDLGFLTVSVWIKPVRESVFSWVKNT
jgi:hypothetical protein